MSDTLVFIPAWNEEGNLGPVLDALQMELPSVDVLLTRVQKDPALAAHGVATADVASKALNDAFSVPRHQPLSPGTVAAAVAGMAAAPAATAVSVARVARRGLIAPPRCGGRRRTP